MLKSEKRGSWTISLPVSFSQISLQQAAKKYAGFIRHRFCPRTKTGRCGERWRQRAGRGGGGREMRHRWPSRTNLLILLQHTDNYRFCLEDRGYWERRKKNCACVLIGEENIDHAGFDVRQRNQVRNQVWQKRPEEKAVSAAGKKWRKKTEEKQRRRRGGGGTWGRVRERVGLVLRWLVWWVGDRESWSISHRSPIASVRGVVGKRGGWGERMGRESVRAWLLKILYFADDK